VRRSGDESQQGADLVVSGAGDHQRADQRIPEMALVADISGVWSRGETLEITW